jgi:hypothetical protein
MKHWHDPVIARTMPEWVNRVTPPGWLTRVTSEHWAALAVLAVASLGWIGYLTTSKPGPKIHQQEPKSTPKYDTTIRFS